MIAAEHSTPLHAEAGPRPWIANFDRLARAYRWLEYLSFGPLLSRCRLHFLNRLIGARNILVLGDGDGRFVERLLRADPEASVDVVDSSARMLAEVSHRLMSLPGVPQSAFPGPALSRSSSGPGLALSCPRVSLHCCDALDYSPRATQQGGARADHAASYDCVVTHFFLDCFSTDDLRLLAGRIRPYLGEGAVWVVSEFALPPPHSSRVISWARNLLACGLITVLYVAFGLLTGLKVRALPDYESVLLDAGFTLVERRSRLGGVLRSDLWRLESAVSGQIDLSQDSTVPR